ncbi:trypsin-like peptidase domain-containing protein [Alphaproteobacteria bacterium]|nr:trypsin-like peptidase domain-containing protein [Alphaproteobacteria bacterium]
MKKVLPILSIVFVFISFELFAKEPIIINIETNKCFGNEADRCSAKKVEIPVSVNTWRYQEPFQCVRLPLMHASRDKSKDNARGDALLYALTDIYRSTYCNAFADPLNLKKLETCSEKFLKGRRLECLEQLQVFVYKPTKNFKFNYCLDKQSKKTTIVPSIIGSCNILEGENWSNETLGSVFGWRSYETPIYTDLLINNTNEEKRKAKESQYGFLIPKALGITNSLQLDTATICLIKGSSIEKDVKKFFGQNEMSYYALYVSSNKEALDSFKSGRCDIYIDTLENLENIASNNSRYQILDDFKTIISDDNIKIVEEEKKLKELEEKRIVEEKRLKELEEKRLAEEKRQEEEKNKQEETLKLYSVSSGTGFFISDNGYIITNNHVTNFCNTNDIHYNGLPYETVLIANDPINDLSLLKANIKTNYNFSLAKEDIGLLEDIYIAGFPFGYDLSTSVKVTQGIVSALSGLENNFARFQVDAALQKGNSGGPIIDMKGNVVGVAVEKANYKYILENFDAIPENLNFGIKLSTLESFVKSNGINVNYQDNVNISKTEIGKLITNATVYVDCLMTKARYEEVESKNQKVLFKKIK